MVQITSIARPASTWNQQRYRLSLIRRDESFRVRLVRLCGERGWTWNDLARASGVPAPTIKQSAQQTGVRAETIYRLASALGVTMGYLFTGREAS